MIPNPVSDAEKKRLAEYETSSFGHKFYRSDFPGCCGAVILQNFSVSHIYKDLKPADIIDIFVRKAVIDYHKLRAFIVVTLADSQEKVVGPILKQNGFKRVFKGVNNGYHAGTKVGFWIRDNTALREGPVDSDVSEEGEEDYEDDNF